jgi:hypothetical protein
LSPQPRRDELVILRHDEQRLAARHSYLRCAGVGEHGRPRREGEQGQCSDADNASLDRCPGTHRPLPALPTRDGASDGSDGGTHDPHQCRDDVPETLGMRELQRTESDECEREEYGENESGQ